jgi:hypothetical protein
MGRGNAGNGNGASSARLGRLAFFVLLNIRIFAGRDDSAPFAPPRAGAKKLKADR